MSPTSATDPLDLFGIDALLDDEERAMRDTVRRFCDDQIRPHVAQWYEEAALPARELAKELGALGLMGMHLEGYGCAGHQRDGVRAGLHGARGGRLRGAEPRVRAGIARDVRDLELRERGAEGGVAAADGGRRRRSGASGSPSPTSARTPAACAPGPGETATTGCSTAPRCGSPTAPIADVAVVWARTDDDRVGEGAIRGFVVPTDTPGFSAPEIKQKMSLRASVTSELVLEDVRLPASAMLPEAQGLGGPLSCLTEARFGIVFGALGAARDCLETAIAYAQSRQVFDKPLAAYQLTQAEARRHDARARQGHAARPAPRSAEGRRQRSAPSRSASASSTTCARRSPSPASAGRSSRANGITLEYPVMRHANNLESVLTYEGTSEVHQLVDRPGPHRPLRLPVSPFAD